MCNRFFETDFSMALRYVYGQMVVDTILGSNLSAELKTKIYMKGRW